MRTPLPEIRVPGRRLGRHLHHDPRSLAYVRPESAAPPADVLHAERIPILDQGDTGSCTGNAETGMLGTEPFYSVLPTGTTLNEAYARDVLYHLATTLDPYPGTYPPTDTGSDGLSVSKAAKSLGLIGGYTHATSLASCWTMIGDAPFIFGCNWYEGMDDPDVHGNVEVSGQVRGGHEVCFVGYAAGKWKVRNSWGEGWGDAGHFELTDDQAARLLSEQGDATQGTPLDQPAPTPTPPTPTPTPVPGLPVQFTVQQFGDLSQWAASPHRWHNSTAAAKAWNAATS
jgi:hypothetical protein